MIVVGSVQFTGAWELSVNPEPWRGRVYRSGEIKVPRHEHPHEKATAEPGS